MLALHTVLHQRYFISELLAQGGMGTVYLAEDRQRPRRYVAIKELSADPLASAGALAQVRRQFVREAQILQALHHPNLPRVYETFSTAGKDYLVMDYIEGRHLEDILEEKLGKGQLLGEMQVLGWVLQVLDALTYLHTCPQPVIHRDIKPQNLILATSGEIFLVDFGLVKLLDPNDPRTTMAVKQMGTMGYAPLEQYGSTQQCTDPRTDIYALGATVYHLLTGERPASAHQRVISAAALIPPRSLNPDLSLAVERVLLRAMEIRPDDRFQSALEMKAALMHRPGSLRQGAISRSKTPQLPLAPHRKSAAISKPVDPVAGCSVASSPRAAPIQQTRPATTDRSTTIPAENRLGTLLMLMIIFALTTGLLLLISPSHLEPTAVQQSSLVKPDTTKVIGEFRGVQAKAERHPPYALTFIIQANQESPTPTGLVVRPGATIKINAGGQAVLGKYNTICNCTPTTSPEGQLEFDGQTFTYLHPYALLPTAHIGSLIGRIGNGSWFYIGKSMVMKAHTGGTLLLAYNAVPTFYSANSGSYSVTLTLSR